MRRFSGILGWILVIELLNNTPSYAGEIRVRNGGGTESAADLYEVGETAYLSAAQAGELFGGRVYWYPVSGRVELSFRGRAMRFTGGSREAWVAGRPSLLSKPVLIRTSRAYIPLDFFLSPGFAEASGSGASYDPARRILVVKRGPSAGGGGSSPPASYRPRLGRRIVVDAGHGGKDPGAKGRGKMLEKEITLEVARELAERLRKDGGFEVLLTRAGDAFVPLDERARVANEFKGDLFISVHCNYHRRRSEKGFEIYFLSEKASDADAEAVAGFENESLRLEGRTPDDLEAAGLLYALAKTEFINDASSAAGLIAREFGRRTKMHNRGVKQADFHVLRNVAMPSVLVELGFLSNEAEHAKLKSKGPRREMAEAIVMGVLQFAKLKGW